MSEILAGKGDEPAVENSRPIAVTMLGELSLRCGDATVSDATGHSKKVWLLLAYLVCNRGRVIPREELAGLLWDDGHRPTNLANAMKTTLFRVRACLDKLYEGAGHSLVLCQGPGYCFDPEAPLSLDVEEFQALCAEKGSGQLDALLQAAAMYGEGFIPKLRQEPWAGEQAEALLKQYLQAVQDALPLLEERRRWREAAGLCQEACQRDPLNEGLYCRWMSALIHLGEHKTATQVYENMTQLFLAQAGALPGDEAQAVYRQAAGAMSGTALASASIVDQLSERPSSGAYLCDYDVFRALYRLQVRDSARSGEETSLAVLTVVHKHDGELTRRSLDLVMGNLMRLVPGMLRQGDAVAQCSAAQFVLLLPRANYQNAKEVCRRINRAFYRQYPHSPATLQITVCPLKPGEQPSVPVEDGGE